MKGKIWKKTIFILCVIGVLVFSFWYGGNAPGTRGFSVSRETVQENNTGTENSGNQAAGDNGNNRSSNGSSKKESNNTTEKQNIFQQIVMHITKKDSSNTSKKSQNGKQAQKNADKAVEKEQRKKKTTDKKKSNKKEQNEEDVAEADSKSIASVPEQEESKTEEKSEERTEEKTEAKTEQPTEEKTEEKTEASTEAKVEEGTTTETVADSENMITCTVYISCATVLNNMKYLDNAKKNIIPKNGVMLEETAIQIREGSTVFDVLQKATKENNIHLEYTYTALYKTYYIEGIGNLYEFDCGNTSGWMFSINDEFPGGSSSAHKVQDGDAICWLYSCNLGKDVGEYFEE